MIDLFTAQSRVSFSYLSDYDLQTVENGSLPTLAKVQTNINSTHCHYPTIDTINVTFSKRVGFHYLGQERSFGSPFALPLFFKKLPF